MSIILIVIAVAVFIITCLSAMDLFFGIRKMVGLAEVPRPVHEETGLVSVIVPACNEEEGIEGAILSHLQQDYGNLEVVAVNDRSTDATGEILERLSERNNRLRVIHIDNLPAGWMGKAHAMQCGARAARGEYLLFTDGDTLFEPSTIARAVHRMELVKRDHLAIVFRNISKGWLLGALILDSGASLFQLFRPWKARDAHSRNFIGVGAFNMIRREAYWAIGGHETIRMHPIDDIMLGKRLKRSGYGQECLLGDRMVNVPWYSSIGEMARGLNKNALAMINYRFALLPPLLAAMVLVGILPLWGAVFLDGPVAMLFAFCLVIKVVVLFFGARRMGVSSWCAPLALLTPHISIYIVLRAAWCNFRDGGVIWRGTHYPLSALRDNEAILP